MTLVTSHYHHLTCNGRVENIVDPTCEAKSPGAWHDAESMEAVALERGWVKAGRGHLCPACGAAAAARSDSTGEPEAKPGRSKRGRVEQAKVEPASDWTGEQAVGQ